MDNLQPVPEMDPATLATKAEHDRMIAALAAEKEKEGGTPILGPDGQPVEPPKVEQPSPDEQKKRARDLAKRTIEARVAKIKELLQANPELQLACNGIQQAWMLLFFLLNKIQTFPGMTGELVQHVSDASRANAMGGGFVLGELCAKVKNDTLPYIKQLEREGQAIKKKREARRQKQVNRFGPEIPLPSVGLVQALEAKKRRFELGTMLVVHGPYDAIRKLLKLVSAFHYQQSEGRPAYLSSQQGEQQADWAHTILPPAWWKGCLNDDEAKEKAFKPVLKNDCMVLLVEDVTLLHTEASNRPDREKKIKALSELYEFAHQEQLAVIVGLPDPDHSLDVQTFFGDVPHARVSCPDFAHIQVGDELLELK